jgi:hypothetical protein
MSLGSFWARVLLDTIAARRRPRFYCWDAPSIPWEELFTKRLRYQDYQRTVRLIRTECDRPPNLPLTLTLKVPVVAELLTVSVNVLLAVAGFGLKEADTPPGRLDAEKVTLPVKPFVGWMVIVLVPLVPRVIVTLDGDAERL